MFEKLRVNAAANRLMEERLYEVVSREVASGVIREGLMAKALAVCGSGLKFCMPVTGGN